VIGDRDLFLHDSAIAIWSEDRWIIAIAKFSDQDRKNRNLFGDRQCCQNFKIMSLS